MTRLEDIYDYYKRLIAETERFATTFGSGDLWTFLMCSSYIDYLVKLVNNKDKTTQTDYKEFIKVYLSQVNKQYNDFRYQSGMQDLPEQIYYVLRCGITHSYSLFPDKQSQKNGGRKRSIVLGHRKHGEIHLSPYRKNGNDSVIFTMEDFTQDLSKVLDLIFLTIAPKNPTLSNNILQWVQTYPPIQQLL